MLFPKVDEWKVKLYQYRTSTSSNNMLNSTGQNRKKHPRRTWKKNKITLYGYFMYAVLCTAKTLSNLMYWIIYFSINILFFSWFPWLFAENLHTNNSDHLFIAVIWFGKLSCVVSLCKSLHHISHVFSWNSIVWRPDRHWWLLQVNDLVMWDPCYPKKQYKTAFKFQPAFRRILLLPARQ